MSGSAPKRVILLILAVWLVWIGYHFIARLPVAELWHNISSPSDSKIAKRLNDNDPDVRREALAQVSYRNRRNRDIIIALTGIATDEGHPDLQVKAISELAAVQSDSGIQTESRLPQDTVENVSALVLKEQGRLILTPLLSFLANNARWQSQPQLYILRLTALLETKQGKAYVSRLLHTVKAFARFHDLPVRTYDEVLNMYQNTDIRWGYEAWVASEVFYAAAHHQLFPDQVREAIEQALRDHHNRDIRRNAVFTLGNQSNYTGVLSPALHDALDDPDQEIRNNAGWQITHFKEVQGKKAGDSLAVLLATARDSSQSVDVRTKALLQAARPITGVTPEAALTVAEGFIHDQQPEIRASGVSQLTLMSQHDAYQQRLHEIHHWLQLALTDEHVIVRRAAVSQLGYIRLDENKRHDYIVSMLKDPDSEVVKLALRQVGLKKMDSPEIESVLHELQVHQDPVLKNTASTRLEFLEQQRLTGMEKFVRTIQDRKSWGGLFYMIAAGFGILLAAVYAIYFTYHLLTNLMQKSWRSLSALVVLLTWVVTTYTMVGLFVVGIFGMGHNTAAPLQEQLRIDGILFAALLIYAGGGWLMHYLVRQPVKTKDDKVGYQAE